MYRLFIVLMLMFAAIYLTNCGLSEDTVAKVGRFEIKIDDYKTELSRRFPNKTSYTDVDSAGKMGVLDRMIMAKLKLNAAYDLDLKDDDSILKDFKQQKSRLLANKYFEKTIVDKIVLEEDVKEFFEKQKEEIRTSHILISFKGAQSSRSSRTKEEAGQLAESLADRAKSGEDFAKLAVEYSDDPSAKSNKGDLGYFTWGKMVNEFQKAAFNMNPGEISDPVQTNYGFHIIKVVDRRPNPKFDDLKFEDQRFEIKRRLYFTKKDSGQMLWDEHQEKVKKDKSFKLLDENLENVTKIVKDKNESGLVKISDYTEDEKEIVLAEWEGGKFLLNDLLEIYEKRFNQFRTQATNMNSLEQVVKNSAFMMVIDEMAEKMGLDDEKDIQESLKKFKERKMLSLLEKKEITEKAKVEEEDMQKYYEEHKNEFTRPAEIEIWEIYVKDEKLGKKIAKWARSGKDFEKLAEKYSDDPVYKKKKGYVGYKAKNRRGAVSKKALEIGEEQISDLFKYRSGWTVIKTGKKKPETIKSYEDARNQVKSKLRNSNLRDRRKEWEKELREEFSVKINNELVDRI